MSKYEIMYIVKPTDDESFNKIVDDIDKLITDNKGIVTKTDKWGKKLLAYEIQNLAEGMYVLVTFEGSSACVKELDRVMRIKEPILRHMIINKNAA